MASSPLSPPASRLSTPPLHQGALGDAGPAAGLKAAAAAASSKSPQRILFVEELTKVLTDNMPDIWRLGQAYFSGKLLKEVREKDRVEVDYDDDFS